MNIHKNARLTPFGREVLVRRIVDEGLRVHEAAHAGGVSVRTAYKWLKRYRRDGIAGLQDCSSRPARMPTRTSEAARARIIDLQHQRRTYQQIHACSGAAPSTIARILARQGLNRLSALEPKRAAHRYVCNAPGGLLHLDIKKRGRFQRPGHRVTGDRRPASRGAGWAYVHVAVDDASRLGFTTIHRNESARSACKALIAALRYYAGFGIRIQHVITDNGACYRSRRFRRLCRHLKLRPIRIWPLAPRVPTARPSASSRPRCASGLTPKPMTARRNAPSSSRDGCTNTIGAGRTLASTTNHPSVLCAYP